MTKDLIFEIGTEEIPAAFVPKALASLEGLLKKALESGRLSFKGIRTLGTPRRLTLIVEELADKQPDTKSEIRGPQKKACFDDAGNPTNALLGFAKSQGIDPKKIKIIKNEKGEYAYAIKNIKGVKTINILPDILKNVISQDFFPRSMRWGAGDIRFARPVHWILACYNGKTVKFEWGHIKSSSHTYGHRFLGGRVKPASPIKVNSAESYLEKLRESYVIADPDERRRIIADGLAKGAGEVNGRVLPDESLLEEVTYLVEFPVVIRGGFSPEFSSIPRDVIINAMREHQRYFSIVDEKGELLPYFMTVANTKAADMDVIRKGNERVLRARLNDAKFYFEHDIKKSLAARVDDLKGVVFQAKLGTSFEKVERFTELALYAGCRAGFSQELKRGEKPADFLTEDFNPAAYDASSIDPGLYSKFVLGRAAMLSKADLTSGMVGEFPKLQGIMGSIYARRSNEAIPVSVAIYEHYLPASSGGVLPASVPGAIISIADKIDSITGCFGVGLIPTGALDPYALRRQALGIIAVMIDKGFRIPLDELIEESVRLLEPRLTRGKNEVREDVLEFFKDRLKNMLLGQNLSFDSIDAVLSAPWFDVVDAVKRIKALEGFKKHPFCQDLVIAFKRVSNILKGLDLGEKLPDQGLFKDPQEKELYDASRRIAPVIDKFWKSGNYEAVFETLASIKDKIDAFFDKVMVMVEDGKIRNNRLTLLNSVRGLYVRIADLSRLAA